MSIIPFPVCAFAAIHYEGRRLISEKEACNKDYNESSKFTGGITHLTCNHNIVKGFTAMKRGESVKQIVNPCVTRLPRRVQARRRFLIYDNACQARSYTERRFPHRVRHWTFLVDRKHWDNHTTCSQAYCMDEYPSLKLVSGSSLLWVGKLSESA